MNSSGPRQSAPIATPHVAGEAGPAAPLHLDAAQILTSVGEVAYDWHIDSDVLLWGTNVTAVLLIRDTAAIATGRAYAQVLEAENAQARFDAVMQSEIATTAMASPTRFNTASAPIPPPRRGFGSRTLAAGLPAPTDGRRGRMGSFASSTSATNTCAGSHFLPAATA